MHDDPRLRAWRRDWAVAVTALDGSAGQALRDRLNSLGLPEQEVEMEREMLDGLEEAAALAAQIARSGLPLVETGHRVVGAERCHFTATVSMPDETGQPAGRLLLTERRAIFLGGPSATSTAWHTIGEVRHTGRDLLLVRTTRDRIYRFQCTSFSDALRAAIIVGELIRKPVTRPL